MIKSIPATSKQAQTTLACSAGLIALFMLSGCISVLQSSYDSYTEQECRKLPTPGERLACSQAADDAQRQRRQADRSS